MADSVAILDVLLYGEPIGTLTRFSDDRTLFAFDASYIADSARPTLSLGFKDSLGGLITDHRAVQTRLMPFFSNLLPEGHLRRYLAERAGVSSEREFFLVWALGQDLPGALSIRSANADSWPRTESSSSMAQIQSDENVLRFSLAGVQLKFSAVEEARHSLTIRANGVGGSWIVKLPSREFQGVPENEYSMMTLARLVGIDVPPVKLVDVGAIGNLPGGLGTLQGNAFVIERFDRLKDGSSVHIEDFAQIFRVYPHDKYRKASYVNIASVIAAEGSASDVAEFVRRLTFNALIGNADMHLKNWSMIYPDRRSAALAPAYDFVSTVGYLDDESAALTVSRTKRFDQFTEDELSHLADRARLPRTLVIDTARETVSLFREQWMANKKHLPLTKHIIGKLEAHLATVPLAKR
ncbi:MAG TPA: type II toxin-antitoxin system HipA family toxin [Steroidobacter sp.]|uniref:type II toxin-antitoxin system HipA family toxin n=1 Tax=Steroidobacter sp. TaxID=1978227 RepID=UPI002EDA14C7